MKSWQSSGATLMAIGALFACSSEGGGPSSITIGAELQNGPNGPRAVCVRLPVLLGSQSAATTSVGSAFDMDLLALRHNAHIRFPGARNAEAAGRTLSLGQLSAGYAETVTVSGSDGVEYEVLVHSGCSDTSNDDP